MKNILLPLICLLFVCCNRTTSEGNVQNADSVDETTVAEKSIETPTEEAVEPQVESAKEKAARMQGSHQKLQAPNAFREMPAKLVIPALDQLCQNKYGCLKQLIHPVGWSEDGKFTYCIEYPNEASDMYRMDFFVHDMKTNKQVDQASFKGESKLTFQEIWRNKNVDFVEDLSRHNIQAANSFEIKPFPMIWEDMSLSCMVDKQKEKSDYTGGDILASSQLWMKGKDEGGKQIAKETYGKYDLILDAEVLGYLKCPFGEQILIVYAKEKRGFEGPPNILELSFIGYDLLEE